MILGPKTKSLNDCCINHDFAFSSSQIEQNYLIPSQNISTNQNMDNDFSLESVNQDCPLQTRTSNFNIWKVIMLYIQIYLLIIVHVQILICKQILYYGQSLS